MMFLTFNMHLFFAGFAKVTLAFKVTVLEPPIGNKHACNLMYDQGKGMG